ncbi:hypothetical protein N1031_04255 [Herbiconiux moechotypicola]|uniref:Nitrate ABC transporter substrate-binding protein n=1 Tax=Herbiconiux moechotypicola TaxID=637393 RepID=A0ABP5Q4T6_9MICO|nr:hypothetical protein [Herbiconiux moechotypicola]MCS5728962.1 hypothetical protein [Herbiconiux moechotypicola]
MSRIRVATGTAVALSSALLLAACSSSAPAAEDAEAAGGDGALSACPSTVVLQTNWFPEPEHSAAYALIDPATATIDADAGIYSGPAIADPSITVEVRAGGPFIGFQQSTALLYSDDSIMLAMIDTDESVKLSKDQPTKAVYTPLQKNPQILFWDPEMYSFSQLSDIAASDSTVLYFQGATYMDYLIAQGDVRADQVDGSFDGSVTRLVAGEPVVMQGYITQEPYRLKNDFPDYGRDVDSFLIADSGYDIYPAAWSGKPDVVEAQSDCLAQLVPAMQQAQIDYMESPDAVNQALSDYLVEIDQFFQITPELAQYVHDVMQDEAIVTNGADGVFGSFDPERMERMTGVLTDIYSGTDVEVADGLTADDIYTNEFLDPSISYAEGK